MRIAYLVNNICQVGGIERVVCRLSTYFADQLDYDVEIHSIYSSDKQKAFLPVQSLSESFTITQIVVPLLVLDKFVLSGT